MATQAVTGPTLNTPNWREQLEGLKERVVNDLLGVAFGKLGDKIGGAEARAGLPAGGASTSGGIPVQVKAPPVRELLPVALLFGAVLLGPAVLAFLGRRRR